MPKGDSAAGGHAALRDDTLLCSQMLANNELGAVTDVAAIDKEVRARGALLHVDAAQVIGINLARWLADLMSLSTLKPFGSKGIGTLYVVDRAYPQLQTQIYGGEHARGPLSCTLVPHQIVAWPALAPAPPVSAKSGNARIDGLSARLREELLALPGGEALSVAGAHPTRHRPQQSASLNWVSVRAMRMIETDPRKMVRKQDHPGHVEVNYSGRVA